MQERTNACEHNFVCVTKRGDFGEIAVARTLSATQIDQVKRDSTQAEKLCPHGVIQCSKCSVTLLPQHPQKEIPDTSELARKLKRF